MSFIVFLNAWNLQSHEVDKGSNTPNMWQLVNSLLRKCIEEKIRSIGPHASAPGSDLPTLVLLLTEPLAWHTLVIQSCARSVVPSGKRKKKGGPAEQSNTQLSQGIQESVQSVCNIIQEVLNWLKEQISKSDDTKLERVLSSLHGDGQSEGPGKVFQIITKLTSSANDMELGDRISQALQSWSPADVVRKITTSQVLALQEFSKICESKLKSLQALKAHL